jgi:hypothetical protein
MLLIKVAKFTKLQFKTRPLASNFISTMFLMGAGDAIAQYNEIRMKASVQYTTDLVVFKKNLENLKEIKASEMETLILKQNFDQKVKESKSIVNNYNTMRTFNATMIGAIIGPIMHYWYIYLEKRFPFRSFKAISYKMVLDQTLCSPICNFVYVFGYHSLDGETFYDCLKYCKDKFLIIYLVILAILFTDFNRKTK